MGCGTQRLLICGVGSIRCFCGVIAVSLHARLDRVIQPPMDGFSVTIRISLTWEEAMNNPVTVVHIQWAGPFSWEGKQKSEHPLVYPSVNDLNGSTDYGVYQVYGCHAIYGVDTLLYIGKACEQTFAVRLRQESDWRFHGDLQRLTVYVGRLSGWNGTPSNTEWEEHINHAEKLLILAHKPAYNAQKGIDYNEERLQEFHVLNWGCHRSLLPEVSGWRYSSKFDDESKYKPFSYSCGSAKMGSTRAGT